MCLRFVMSASRLDMKTREMDTSSRTPAYSSLDRASGGSGRADEAVWEQLLDEHLPPMMSLAEQLGLEGRAMANAVELAWLRLAQRMPHLPVPTQPWLLRTLAEEAARHGQRSLGPDSPARLDLTGGATSEAASSSLSVERA